MAADPLLLPATQQAALLRDGKISAVELLDLTLARIAAVNGALNAVVHCDEDGARRAAADADERLRSGEARPLEGLPVTIKDALDVAGMVSTAGHPGLKGRIPTEDAVAVRRLRAAGAIISARRTSRSSPAISRPSTPSMASRTTRGTSPSPPAAPPAARRRPWRRA